MACFRAKFTFNFTPHFSFNISDGNQKVLQSGPQTVFNLVCIYRAEESQLTLEATCQTSSVMRHLLDASYIQIYMFSTLIIQFVVMSYTISPVVIYNYQLNYTMH